MNIITKIWMRKAYCKTNFNVFLHRKSSTPETQPPCQTYNQVQDHCGFTTIYHFTPKIYLVILLTICQTLLIIEVLRIKWQIYGNPIKNWYFSLFSLLKCQTLLIIEVLRIKWQIYGNPIKNWYFSLFSLLKCLLGIDILGRDFFLVWLLDVKWST